MSASTAEAITTSMSENPLIRGVTDIGCTPELNNDAVPAEDEAAGAGTGRSGENRKTSFGEDERAAGIVARYRYTEQPLRLQMGSPGPKVRTV